MTKTQILQRIFHKGNQTIGRINQQDVCDITGITANNLNAYVQGKLIPSDKQMNRIIDACQRIAAEKCDFILIVKRDGWDD